MRCSLQDNRERLSKSCYEKRALPDARRKIDRQAHCSWQEYKGKKETICRSQKIVGCVEGYVG
jgi:hypothetical protein